jgi:hypothetical protein
MNFLSGNPIVAPTAIEHLFRYDATYCTSLLDLDVLRNYSKSA